MNTLTNLAVALGHAQTAVAPAPNPASGSIDVTRIVGVVVPLLYTVGLVFILAAVLFVKSNRTAAKSAEQLGVALIAGIIGALAFFSGVVLQFGGGIVNLVTGGGGA